MPAKDEFLSSATDASRTSIEALLGDAVSPEQSLEGFPCHFNHDRHLIDRQTHQDRRSAALA